MSVTAEQAAGAAISKREAIPHSESTTVGGIVFVLQPCGWALAQAISEALTVMQAVHSGGLIPATARAATVVRRSWPSESRLQNSSGASAVMSTRAYLAAEPAAPPESDELASSPMAPAAVEKYAGSGTSLTRN